MNKKSERQVFYDEVWRGLVDTLRDSARACIDLDDVEGLHEVIATRRFVAEAAGESNRLDGHTEIDGPTLAVATELFGVLAWIDVLSNNSPEERQGNLRSCVAILLKELPVERADVMRVYASALERDDEHRRVWDGWLMEGGDDFEVKSIDFVRHLDAAAAAALLHGRGETLPDSATCDEILPWIEAGGVGRALRTFIGNEASRHWLAGVDSSELGTRASEIEAWLPRVAREGRTSKRKREMSLAIPDTLAGQLQEGAASTVAEQSTFYGWAVCGGVLESEPRDAGDLRRSIYSAELIPKTFLVGEQSETWNRDRAKSFGNALADGVDRTAWEALTRLGKREDATSVPLDALWRGVDALASQGLRELMVLTTDWRGVGAQIWHAREFVAKDRGKGRWEGVGGFIGLARRENLELAVFELGLRNIEPLTVICGVGALKRAVVGEWPVNSGDGGNRSVRAWCEVHDLAVDESHRRRLLDKQPLVEAEEDETPEEAAKRLATVVVCAAVQAEFMDGAAVLVLSSVPRE